MFPNLILVLQIFSILIVPLVIAKQSDSNRNVTYISDKELKSKYKETLKWTGMFTIQHNPAVYKAGVRINHSGLYRECYQSQKHGNWSCSKEIALKLPSGSKSIVYEAKFNYLPNYNHIRVIGQYMVGNGTDSTTHYVTTPSHNEALLFDESADFTLLQKMIGGIVALLAFFSCTFVTCDCICCCCKRSSKSASSQRYNRYQDQQHQAIDIESTEDIDSLSI